MSGEKERDGAKVGEIEEGTGCTWSWKKEVAGGSRDVRRG